MATKKEQTKSNVQQTQITLLTDKSVKLTYDNINEIFQLSNDDNLITLTHDDLRALREGIGIMLTTIPENAD